MRSVRLESRVIANKGIGLSDKVITQCKADYLRELQVRLPSLKRGHEAWVELLTQSTDAGLTIEAYLRESPQLSLPLAIDKQRHIRQLLNDPFLQLVQQLECDRRQLVLETVIASNSSELMVQIAGGLQIDERSVELRREASRKHKYPHGTVLNGLNNDLIEIDIPPRLALSENATIYARIRSMTARTAQLSNIEEDASSATRRPSGQSIPQQLALRRVDDADHLRLGRFLQEAMDLGRLVQLDVGIRFNGIDGRVADLELLAASDCA